MLLLTADALSYNLPGRTLLESVSLGLDKGEKVGLIGRNGCGKSTLLRLLAGELVPDQGEITVRGTTKIRLLDQLPSLQGEEGRPLHEVVARGSIELLTLHQDYQQTCSQLDEAPASERRTLEARLSSLTDELTHHDAWDLKTRASTLLTTLGFPDPERPFQGLSGGEEKRLGLARTLLVPPDILLLDEPTNHLDIATIGWLESFLSSSTFTTLMITHDRFFLERVCTRILEISQGGVTSFSGSYSAYLEQKALAQAAIERQQERFDNILRREQAWLLQGPRARSTKQKARIKRTEDMASQGSGLHLNDQLIDEAGWDLGARRLGQRVLDLVHAKARVLAPTDFHLKPGEKVGLIGTNGSGKTTFLDLLAGRLTPEEGERQAGETVHLAYFDQHTDRLQTLPDDTRVLDAVKDVATSLPLTNGKELSASRLCEMFLFSGSAQATPLCKLSGGERKRLEILRWLMDRPNVLLLDEPTNDLDIETLQRLEFYLESFPGSLVVASHDRFLLSRLCDRLLVFRRGQIEELLPDALHNLKPGFFDTPSLCLNHDHAAQSSRAPTQLRPTTRKLTYKEQQEFLHLEVSIPQLEAELLTIEKQLSSVTSDYTQAQVLFNRKEAAEYELDQAMERWSELDEISSSP